ncbi:hypothetical protein [Streptomyces sulphureus]|uniref:hypothetical protein n=1 Tax=Streptomyces sulphureus TaxID=47758 RepID=UPI000477A6A6|nr:hypothetical protein [Streptomyces sulphureus]
MPNTVNSRTKRRSRLLRYAAGAAALLGLGAYGAALLSPDSSTPARCLASIAEGDRSTEYSLEPVQAANAATITAVASQRGLPERAVTIAIATAIQESSLRNLDHGDRDSLGLFQQRPSQGWGSEEEILDPVYSAGKFYDHLLKIPGYSRLPLTVAAQRVQRSGFPQAYAKHESDASLLSAALTGRKAAALTCTTGPDGEETATVEASEVRERLVRDFGKEVLPESGRLGGTTRGAGTDDDELLAVPAKDAKRGWELAHWAVTHAPELDIEEITYGGRVWSADHSRDGWRSEKSEGASRGTVVLRLAR